MSRAIYPFLKLTVIMMAVALCQTVVASDDEARISDLSPIDSQYMQDQRALINDLAARHFGRHFSGNKTDDLGLLQRLLDQRVVHANQTRELQAMGVIMGDLLAKELGLHWVIYEDRQGRSRALRYKETDNYLFPMTMISRRWEVGNHTPVAEIYEKAHAAMVSQIPPLPFQ